MVGWLYWYFWVVVVGFEAIAGGKVITYWFHMLLWLPALILMAIMTVNELFSIISCGELKFYFARIKITAIKVFWVSAMLFVLGLWLRRQLELSNLGSHGGSFPNGVRAVFAAIVVAIFSMVGVEIATIVAAETPTRRARYTARPTSWLLHIMVFFIGSVFLLVVLLPWEAVQIGA